MKGSTIQSVLVAILSVTSVLAVRPRNIRYKGLSTPLNTFSQLPAAEVEQDDFYVPATNGIKYTVGNPILTGTVNIYNIWYGSWTDQQIAITENFFDSVGESQWWNTETKYYFQPKGLNQPKTYVGKNVVLAKSVRNNYTKGKQINGTMIPDIIETHINHGDLPADGNAVYFFLSSPDVTESIRPDLGYAAFCEEYCGYHVSWKLKSGLRVFYAMTGNPASCLDGCAPPQNQVHSPNGDAGVDAMISVIAHELAEAVSDPVSDVNSLRAWQDSTGYENADKCAYKYGVVKKDAASGSSYNTQMGPLNYMVQMNWDPATQTCSQG